MAIIIMQQRLTAHLSWELPVERPKKRIIETKWQLARWPPTRARSEPEENIKLESGVGGRGRKPFNYVLEIFTSGSKTPLYKARIHLC